MKCIGIDIGGTKIEGIITDESITNVLHRERISSVLPGECYADFLNRLYDLINRFRVQINGNATIGIGTTGIVSSEGKITGISIPCINHQPLKDDLEKKLKIPIALENDANCFALSETLFGNGMNKSIVLGVILGTGVGTGLIINGKIIKGAQGAFGEWGHISYDPNGFPCACGQKGCIETYISGTGLQAAYYRKTGKKNKATEIYAKYLEKEPQSLEIFEDFFHFFGRAIALFTAALNPDVIIFGGGLSEIKEIYELGPNYVAKYLFNPQLKILLKKAKFGDASGTYGAALLGKQAFLHHHSLS